jgi:uncharacterized protein
MIDSPCINVCTLDARSRLCLGCGRTIEEITRWASMNGTERERIMGELAGRLAARSSTKTARVTG